MPAKIRLTRQGRKKLPYYHIVISDSRAPRDGKYIERIGSYNPVTHPATVELDFDKALYWVQQGAQPTDTCRSILSGKGVMLKKHLLEGVKKGALTSEQADAKFESWIKEKEAQVRADKSKIEKANADKAKQRLEIETKIKEAKAEEVAKKLAKQEAAESKASAETEAEASTEAEVTTENVPEVQPEAKTKKEEVKAEPETKVEAETPVAEESEAKAPQNEEPAAEEDHKTE